MQVLSSLPPGHAEALTHAWRFWGRPEQLAPGTKRAAIDRTDWSFWLLLAGRGFGKTRSGSEWSVEQAKEMPGSHGALVAPTADDARKVMVSYGLEHQPEASGILAVSRPDFMPKFEPSKRLMTWPNGTTAELFSAEEPERLRGPQFHWAWADEIGAWKRAQQAWDMLMFGLRLGTRPRACVTTTPKPIPLMRQLLEDPQTVITRGTTYDNRANLAEDYFRKLIRRYEGTRLGRQELLAELLNDHPGALWRLGLIEAARIDEAPDRLLRVVVAIDPAVSSTETSSETGIIVAGTAMCGCHGGNPEPHGFVLADGSGKHSPNAWAQEAVALYRRWAADRIVGEVNNGGDLVEVNVRTADTRVPYRPVHASRGKQTRAEPVAALYEQGKVHHVGGFARLEDQLTTWDPAAGMKSPDRLDALVWALTDLMLGKSVAPVGTISRLPNLSRPNPWRM